jgi:hypothetical protein
MIIAIDNVGHLPTPPRKTYLEKSSQRTLELEIAQAMPSSVTMMFALPMNGERPILATCRRQLWRFARGGMEGNMGRAIFQVTAAVALCGLIGAGPAWATSSATRTSSFAYAALCSSPRRSASATQPRRSLLPVRPGVGLSFGGSTRAPVGQVRYVPAAHMAVWVRNPKKARNWVGASIWVSAISCDRAHEASRQHGNKHKCHETHVVLL